MKRYNVIPMLILGSTFVLSGCGMGMDGNPMPGPSSLPIAPIQYDAVFVVNGGSHSLSVIDASKNEVAATLKLEGVAFPHHVNMSGDGASIAVAIPGMDLSGGHGTEGGMDGMDGMAMGTVLRLNAITGETEAGRKLDHPNHNAVFSPDGKEIWTSQMAMEGKVLVLDAMTLATKRSLDVGRMPAEVTFSKGGKYAFVANGMSNSVTVVDAASKAVVKTIPVGEDPVGAWAGSDGMMYVDNEKSMTLTEIDPATLDTVRTYPLGFMPGMAATAPNGELWVTDADDGKVVFYAADTGLKLGELETGAGAHAIVFSGNGNTAYVSNQAAGSVSVVDIASRTVKKDIKVGSKPNGMVFRAM
jgi:YVTN family beta-propeller protein